jgi:hypothetical protein
MTPEDIMTESIMPIRTHSDIATIIEATDSLLCTYYHDATTQHTHPGRLVFPLTAKNTVRVSEQETRQLLIANLRESRFSFSIETPTLGTYTFTGTGERNAMTDLTLYNNGQRHLNIEFKAGNTSPQRKSLTHINKDIQKLVYEKVDAFWFHTLRLAGRNSIHTLWNTIRQELKSVVQIAPEKISEKSFTFHCCVLRESFSIQTTFQVNERSCANDWLNNSDPPKVIVENGVVTTLDESERWIARSYRKPSQS